jgi:Phage capsid family
MTMPMLRRAKADFDASRDQQELKQILYYRMFDLDGPFEAAVKAEASGASSRVVEQLKTASPAATSGSLNAPVGVSLDRLISANAPRGAFETMRPDMTEVPLRTRLILSTAAIIGSEIPEGTAKLMRRLNIANLDTEVAKFGALIAVSLEFMIQAPELVQRLIVSALPEAVSVAVDSYFLNKLAGEEVGESSGETNPSWSLMLADLEELMRIVHVGAASKLYFIMQPRTAKALSRAAFENGIATVRYDGGSIFGIPIITSDAQTDGRITLAEASGMVYGDAGISVRSSDVAALEFSDAPTNQSGSSVTATNLVICFQTNTRALLCERSIAVRVVDTNAVASLTGVQWGAGSGSPSAF